MNEATEEFMKSELEKTIRKIAREEINNLLQGSLCGPECKGLSCTCDCKKESIDECRCRTKQE